MDSSPENPPDNTKEISFTRREIFQFVRPPVLNGNINVLNEIVEAEVSKKQQHPYVLPRNEKDALKTLVSEFRKRWKQVSRKEKTFFKRFDTWLNVPVFFTIKNEVSETSTKRKAGSSCAGLGRPSTSWDDLSDRSKRRRTEKIREEYSVQELAYATQMGLRASGNFEASKVIRDVTEGSPSTASKYRRYMEQVPERMLSGNEALSFVVEGGVTKRQYQLIRSTSKTINCKGWPPYNTVLDAKKKCYPDKSEISITESAATVGVQALLNHTAERLIVAESDVIKNLPENKLGCLELICKWGCDGTSIQSTCKQKFTDEDGNKSDANIFFILLVPLQIYDKVNPQVIIWKNSLPLSPRFCRPIKIVFLHDPAEATGTEVDCIEAQVKNLVPYETIINGRKINIDFKLVLTMIDEEAQESCNKYITKFRRSFSRKCDRTKTMKDVFYRLLLTSDPLISSLRKLPAEKRKSLTADAVELLIPPSVAESNEIPSINSDESDESEDDNDVPLYASDSE